MGKGHFEWIELVSENADAAKGFYTDVVGWGTDSMDMGEGGNYLMFTANGKSVAGVTAPQMEGVPQHWLGYINHNDVNAGVAFLKEKGGTVLVEPFDVPTVGKMAIVQDPFGATFAFITPENEGTVGEIAAGEWCWYEHMCKDVDAARAFYEELFGWKLESTSDMPNGPYHMYNIGDKTMIGFMQLEDAPSGWAYYVHVDDIEGSVEKAKSSGGQVVFGPQDIPNGRIASCIDAQGGFFCLHAALSG